MELDIHTGKRVLYKHNGQWEVGEISDLMPPAITEKGLFLFIIPKEYINTPDIAYLHDVEINDIFLDAVPVEDWMTQYNYLMPKNEYIDFIKSDEFDKSIERAYVSDGEYYYYSINKFTEQWLNKQPFEYVVREE